MKLQVDRCNPDEANPWLYEVRRRKRRRRKKRKKGKEKGKRERKKEKGEGGRIA